MMRLLSLIFLLIRLLWAAPCSTLGLAVTLPVLFFGGRVRCRDGALEVWFGAGRFSKMLQRQHFAAITLGHVILAIDKEDLRRWHAHERVHVRQFEMLGPFMLLAYPAASAWAWAKGQDAYRDNYFERQAYRVQTSSRS